MSELSFLIELLLNHDLPKATKDLLADRIREVESRMTQPTYRSSAQPIPSGPQQSASTLALMAKHGDIGMPIVQPVPAMPPVEVTQVAQTPQTAAAMNSRHEAIAQSLAGKVDKVSGRPRKW